VRPVPLRTLRLAAFVALVAYMAFGPCYRQVLGGRSHVFRSWRMFSGIGIGVVDARFAERLPDGSERRLDRFAVLGYRDPYRAPRAVRRLAGRDATAELARRLCAAFGAGADVRAYSRIATAGGWEPLDDGARNLCEPAAP